MFYLASVCGFVALGAMAYAAAFPSTPASVAAMALVALVLALMPEPEE